MKGFCLVEEWPLFYKIIPAPMVVSKLFTDGTITGSKNTHYFQ